MASPYSPDRWDNLPEAASQLPGLFSNTLSFSAGPRVRVSESLIYSKETDRVYSHA